MNFAERVEQRAQELSKGSWGMYEEYGHNELRKMAYTQIILEWAAANQGAMEALVEGTAWVYEKCPSAVTGGYFIGKRLDTDTPQEKK